MRHLAAVCTLLAGFLAVLLLPAAAHAGGWAITTLSSLPGDAEPGGSWTVELTIMQHGRAPLEGVDPAIVTTGPDGSRRHPARPTGKPGVYRAQVVFGRAGRYTYAVDDGFTNAFPARYPPVQVGEGADAAPAAPAAPVARAAVAPPADGFPWGLFVAGGAAVVAIGAALSLLLRDRAAPKPA